MKAFKYVPFIILALFASYAGKGQTPDFTADIITPCFNGTVIFTNTSSGFSGSETYAWDFGTGASPATATGAGPHSVTYTTSGFKTVSLTVTDGGTDYTETKPNYISVYPDLNAGNISGATTPICYNADEGILTANPTGGDGSYTYLWYKDGISTGITTQTYAAGNLTATTNYYYEVTSCSQTRQSPALSVTVSPDLVAGNITGATSPICANTSEGTLTANPSGGDGSYTYLWYKNGSSTGITTQTYNAGILTSDASFYYEVTSCGQTKTSPAVNITVYPEPVASFTASEECLGSTTSFDASGSSITSGSIVKYEWDFNNNGTYEENGGSNATRTHNFGTAGTYIVGLRVTSDLGCEGTTTGPAIVNPNPSALVSPDPANVCSGTDIVLNGNPSGGSGTYTLHSWTGDTGPLDNTSIVNPTFNTIDVSPTNYDMTYTVTDNKGCQGSDNIRVKNYPAPSVTLAVSDPVICYGETASVTVSASESGVRYQLRLDSDNSPVGSYMNGTGGDLNLPTSPLVTTTYNVLAYWPGPGCDVELVDKAIVTVNPLPDTYEVIGGGYYCAGDAGKEVFLAGSDAGFNYQLRLDGSDTGSPVPGTGSSLNFGNQTPGGNYTVYAVNTSTLCGNTMTGSVDITVNSLPLGYGVTGGGDYCSGGTGVEVSLSGSETGIDYQLEKDGSNIGFAIPGDGSPLSFGNQTSAGNYTVFATNQATGCTNNMNNSVNVTVNPVPSAAFTGNRICLGNPTEVDAGSSAVSSGFLVKYEWDFDNNGVFETDAGSNINSSYTFATADTFTVGLRVTSDKGCQDTGSNSVIVDPLPVPSFTSTEECKGSATGFDAGGSTIATGFLTTYEWDFDNNGIYETNSGSNPTEINTFPDAGSYIVGLQTTSDRGCKQNTTNTVTVNPNPIASFTANEVCLGMTTDFDAGSSSIFTGSIVNYEWDFNNDGIFETDSGAVSTASFTFSIAGNHTVGLRVTSDKGCQHTTTGTITIDPNPVASFSSDRVCFGNTTTFNAGGSTITTGSIIQYDWDFNNDGVFETNGGSNTISGYSFDPAGNYLVSLLITSDHGCIDQISGTAIVDPLPVATLSGDATVCQGTSTDLSVTLSGSPVWSVTFLKNGVLYQSVDTITTQPLLFPVTDDGTYTLLAVSDNTGCSGTVAGSATIDYHPPSASSMSGSTEICEGDSAAIEINLTGTAPWTLTYQRDLGNDVTVTGIPWDTYVFYAKENGSYSVSQISDVNCPGTPSGAYNLIAHSLPALSINGLNSAYNVEGNPVALTATPAGGLFSGPGVVNFPDPLFYPDIAGTANSPHTIIYNYTDTNGCSNADSAIVKVIQADGRIMLPGLIFCHSDDTILIKGENVTGNPGSFSISGGTGLIDLLDDRAIVDPGLLAGNTYTITYSYVDVDTFYIYKDFTVEELGAVDFVDFTQFENCKNSASFNLKGTVPSGFYTGGTGIFSGAGVQGDILSGFEFNPAIASVGDNLVQYVYTSDNGCSSAAARTVKVHDLPSIDFNVVDQCLNGIDSTIFLNNTTTADTVVRWEWNFDDIISGAANVSDRKNPNHLYPAFGRRSVKLTAETNKGCLDTLIRDIDFEDKPIADFTWDNECFVSDKKIHFNDASFFNSPITQYTWKFFNSSDVLLDSMDTKDVDMQFPVLANYTTQLRIETGNGCSDTIMKTVKLRPTISLKDGTYSEDFENGSGDWVAFTGNGSLSSWQMGEPSGSIINKASSGNVAWVTSLAGNHYNNENSWVEGPCFDFSEVKRPMVSLDVFIATEQERDGGVLQYSSDNGLHWLRVGAFDDRKGVNWFNSAGILGEPGNQQQGWSGTIHSSWFNVRHDLDNLKDLQGVRFRIAFGSDASYTEEGFAFDNFRIGERSKTALLEHFTNIGSTASASADPDVDSMAIIDSLDVMVLHYHTNFPGSDPLNAFYPQGPSARALVYQVSQVPYSVMDGLESYNWDGQPGSEWNHADIIRRSLQNPPVSIQLSGQLISGNQVSVDAQISKIDSLPPGDQITIYFVAIEDHVDEQGTLYRNVVRKILPDEGGFRISDDLANGGTTSKHISWSFNPTEIDATHLKIVAFVQNEFTLEIYQSAALDYGLLTGIQPAAHQNEIINLSVYPNPANNFIQVSLGSPAGKNTVLYIYSSAGSLLKTKLIGRGERLKAVPLIGFKPGIYFLRVVDGGRRRGHAAFSIIH